MVFRKYAMIFGMMLSSAYATPAAFAGQDDAVYECWVGCVASRPGWEDWCTAECNRRYGGESTGGGEGPGVPVPGPRNDCRLTHDCDVHPL